MAGYRTLNPDCLSPVPTVPEKEGEKINKKVKLQAKDIKFKISFEKNFKF